MFFWEGFSHQGESCGSRASGGNAGLAFSSAEGWNISKGVEMRELLWLRKTWTDSSASWRNQRYLLLLPNPVFLTLQSLRTKQQKHKTKGAELTSRQGEVSWSFWSLVPLVGWRFIPRAKWCGQQWQWRVLQREPSGFISETWTRPPRGTARSLELILTSLLCFQLRHKKICSQDRESKSEITIS